MNMICLVVLFPLLSFIILFFLKNVLSTRFICLISLISIFFSFLITIFTGILLVLNKLNILHQDLWNWLVIENLQLNICLLLDNLSFSFLCMIIFIGCLVIIFSIWYMKDEPRKSEFFALLSLFLANMMLLVLADNFITLYVGWEGVSVCSYLLINFYYFKYYVSISSIKSFITTKIGDLFFILAILILYIYYGTLNFYEIQFLIKLHVIQYKMILNYINLLILLGAIAKSAQVPFQVWLPEAMVGPTPVSALIHAATMVTAGTYLVCRNHDLFILTPMILYILGILGCITLLISSFSALVQTDIKKILAYSTMSQIGYVFMAMSMGVWNFAVAHLITHAFFKSLLFLSTGCLIKYCNNEQNIFFMGHKLWNKFRFLYVCFLISGASLSAFPIITSGFYSKGNILYYMFCSDHIIFFISSVISILLTTIYIFRLIFLVFHNTSNIIISYKSMSYFQIIPLFILMVLSTFFGIFFIPNLSEFFPKILEIHSNKWIIELLSGIIIIFGIFISYYLYIIQYNYVVYFLNNKIFYSLYVLFKNGFYFLYFYELTIVKLYFIISKFIFSNQCNCITNNILYLVKKTNLYFLKIENSTLSFYITIFVFSILFIECLIVLS